MAIVEVEADCTSFRFSTMVFEQSIDFRRGRSQQAEVSDER
jgi:hypothetical protein